MAKLNVQLEWNDEMGEGWMNIHNLKICLFTPEHTKKELLEVIPLEKPIELAKWRGIAARVWGDQDMESEVMDADMAEQIALMLYSKYGDRD